jgi:hypothetical protein
MMLSPTICNGNDGKSVDMQRDTGNGNECYVNNQGNMAIDCGLGKCISKVGADGVGDKGIVGRMEGHPPTPPVIPTL